MRIRSCTVFLCLYACGPVAPSHSARHDAQASCADALIAPTLGPGAVEVLHVQRDGAWVAVCHVADGATPARILRHGHHGEVSVDAQPILLRPESEPLVVSRFVAVGPTGRWLVVAREGHLILLDTERQTEQPLRPLDANDDPRHFTIDIDHPIVSIDSAGAHLAYMRWADEPLDAVAVVRNLASGTERHVSAPPGRRLLGARIDRSGAWLWLWSVSNGMSVRRFQRFGGGHRQCDRPFLSGRWGGGAPAPARRILTRHAVSLAQISATPSSVDYLEHASAAAGEQLLFRRDDGALEARVPERLSHELADAACAPFGLHVSADGDAVAVLCRATGDIRVYEREANELRNTVTYAPASPIRAGDEEWSWSPRWLRLGADRVVDLEGADSWHVPAGAEILAEAEGRLVYRADDGQLGVASEGATLVVPWRPEWGGGSWRGTAGPYVLIGTGVVDVLTARYGVVAGHPWMVHRSGNVLVTSVRRSLAWEPIHFTERSCSCRPD